MAVPRVTYEELLRQELDTVIIDVRDMDEVVEEGQLETAHCIPLSALSVALECNPEHFSALHGFAKPRFEASITTHCSTGDRARQAAQILVDSGFTNVQCYEGSFKDWLEKGGHIDKPGHPFRHGTEEDDDDGNQAGDEDSSDAISCREDSA